MAGSSVVGALRVTLGLDSAQFTAGMKSAQSGLARFASVAKTGALAVGTAMVAAGGAMAVMMKGVIDEADRMSKLAQSIGIPIAELSKLKYAAALADIDLDKLEKSVRRLSAGMMDAGESSTGAAANAFAMLGVEVRDVEGKMRPATSVIEDLAGKFARMPNGVEKTALAMRIFGKSGADMIPLLNEGADGLAEMYREAEELGIVLDEKTGKAAEAFNDNLTRLGVVKDGIVTKITAGMLPALESLSGAMVTAAKDSVFLASVGAGLGTTLKVLASTGLVVATAFVQTAMAIGMAATAAFKWAQQDYAGAMLAWVGGVQRLEAVSESVHRINSSIWSPGSGATSRPPAAAALDLVDTTANRAARSVNRLTDAERAAARAAEELTRDGARTFEETRTPLEQYTAQVERLKLQLAGAAISQDTFNRAMAQARANFSENDPLSSAGTQFRDDLRQSRERLREDAIQTAADHEEDMRRSTFDGISDGLRAAADGSLGQYLVSRLRDALFDGLANTLTNILRGPKGGDGGAMGWLNAAGSIAKTAFSGRVPGFKTGGSFTVGGSGGLDSQLMQFRATPGEMVDIRKPGQDRGGALTLHVEASPWFDVRAAKASEPVAAKAGVQAFGAARAQAPADTARRRRFDLTGAQ